VKYAFMRDNRPRFDIAVMAAVLGITTAGYYAWLKRPESARAKRARELTDQIRIAHAQSRGIYGCTKILKEVHRHQRTLDASARLNRKTVARLMAAAGIRSKVGRKFRVCTTDSSHDNPIAPNSLDRRFRTDGPNRGWVVDITYIRTDEGFLYLAGVMDLFSRRIVGWSMDCTMTTDLVERALDMAISQRLPTGNAQSLVHHSDRGVQYTSSRYRQLLRQHGIEASMSRRGNCYDNAAMESFWGKLKSEALHHEQFTTVDQARAAVFDYIEVFYNRQRLHASLGYVSPEQFEASRV